MQSRKDWRNRESGAGEGVLALLEALRGGLGAEAVGLFDDDRAGGGSEARTPRGALELWNAFHERSCGPLDWQEWYRELRAIERVESACVCGGSHRLQGFLIHGRWALLLVVSCALSSEGVAAVASSLSALTARLPPGRTGWEASQAAEYDEALAPTPGMAMSASTGNPTAPVWWVRKMRH